jgi:hypothetical protein
MVVLKQQALLPLSFEFALKLATPLKTTPMAVRISYVIVRIECDSNVDMH